MGRRRVFSFALFKPTHPPPFFARGKHLPCRQCVPPGSSSYDTQSKLSPRKRILSHVSIPEAWKLTPLIVVVRTFAHLLPTSIPPQDIILCAEAVS